jgi:hypothetical protein
MILSGSILRYSGYSEIRSSAAYSRYSEKSPFGLQLHCGRSGARAATSLNPADGLPEYTLLCTSCDSDSDGQQPELKFEIVVRACLHARECGIEVASVVSSWLAVA